MDYDISRTLVNDINLEKYSKSVANILGKQGRSNGSDWLLYQVSQTKPLILTSYTQATQSSDLKKNLLLFSHQISESLHFGISQNSFEIITTSIQSRK